MKRKGFLFLLFISSYILYSSFNLTLTHTRSISGVDPSDITTISDLISRGPIVIKDDEPHKWLPFANGSGTPADPYIIENYNITYDASYGPYVHAIEISYSSNHFVLRNCFIKDFPAGVYIGDCDASGIIIENLTILDTDHSALIVGFMDNVTIRDCVISNAYSGITCGGDYSLIENCNVSSCLNYGVLLGSSFSTNVTDCELFENKFGVDCNYESTQGCRIYENIIRDNWQYGVRFVQTTSNNFVYRNDFVRNYPAAASQAFDDGENNLFYDPQLLEGNYWHEHKKGEYLIDGLAASTDPYIQTGPVIRPIEYYGGRVPFAVSSIFLAIGLVVVIKLVRRRKFS